MLFLLILNPHAHTFKINKYNTLAKSIADFRIFNISIKVSEYKSLTAYDFEFHFLSYYSWLKITANEDTQILINTLN